MVNFDIIGIEEQARIRVQQLSNDRRRYDVPQPLGLWVPVARVAGAIRRVAEAVETRANRLPNTDAYPVGMGREQRWPNS